MAVWDEAFYTTTTMTTAATATTTTMTTESLYGYLNTFTINSQEKVLYSRSRRATPFSRTTILPVFTANHVRVSYLFLHDSWFAWQKQTTWTNARNAEQKEAINSD